MRHLPFLLCLGFLTVSCAGSGDKALLPRYSENDLASTSAEISLQDLVERGYRMDTVRLRNPDGAERLLISDVTDVELADGCMFLLTADSKIMRFSPDGVLEGSVGIKGNGPGEYIYVNDIFLAPGGEYICLNDVMKGTITYGLDGTYKGTQARETPGQIVTSISDGQYILESVQTVVGNEADRLRVRDSGGSVTGHFPNHLLFNYTPKATVTAYQDYKSLFRNGAGEIVYHQMSTDTIFTVRPDVPALEPRCCFVLQNGARQSDLSSFADISRKVSLVYDYAEDASFRYVTLIEPGWTKHLYLIDKGDNTVYRSVINVPGTETAFYPKWQSGDRLMDYWLSEGEVPYLVVLEKS